MRYSWLDSELCPTGDICDLTEVSPPFKPKYGLSFVIASLSCVGVDLHDI